MASNVLCNYWFIYLLILSVYTTGISSSDYEHETNAHKRALGVGNWEQYALPKALQHGGFVPGELIASCKGPMCPDPDLRFSKDYHISDPTNTDINLANAALKRFAARRWFPPCTRWGCNGKRDEATDSYRRFKSTILPLQRALDKADTLTSHRMRLAKTNKIE